MDIAITGIGMLTPLGSDLDQFSHAVLNHISGITKYIGPTHNDSEWPAAYVRPNISETLRADKNIDEVASSAVVATRKAIDDCRIDFDNIDKDFVGLYWGNATGAMHSRYTHMEYGAMRGFRFKPSMVVATMPNTPAANISIAFGITGPCSSTTNACAAGAAAIGDACRLLESGIINVAIAGGSEFPHSGRGVDIWAPSCAIAPPDPVDIQRSCKPFSKNRRGFVLGEGAVSFILERTEDAKRRGAKIYARIVGYGNRSDAFDITKPKSEGQVKAMRAALQEAKIGSVDYINAHGTGTYAGDDVEIVSIVDTFGSNVPPISSTKSLHGHLIGAAGNIELLSCITSLQKQVLVPNSFLEDPIDECAGLDMIPEARDAKIINVMSNSFSFGGNNVCLVLSKA